MLWEKIKNYKNEFVLFLCQHSIKLYNDTKLERKCRQKFALKKLYQNFCFIKSSENSKKHYN